MCCMGDTDAPHLLRFALQTLHELRHRYGWCPRDQLPGLTINLKDLCRSSWLQPDSGGRKCAAERPTQCLTGLRCYVAVPSPRDRAVQPLTD